jgi:hypothetical protein
VRGSLRAGWQAIGAVSKISRHSRLVRTAVIALVLALAIAVIGFAACSGGGKHEKKQTAKTTTPTTTARKRVRPLRLGKIVVESAGPKVSLSKTTQRAALALTQQYVDNAVYAPLDSGKIGRRYGALFGDGVRAAATGPDRGALTDLEVGRATAYSASAPPIALFGLADGGGSVLYLATKTTLQVKARTPGGSITISRNVELTLAPSGKHWIVTAYRVLAARKSATASVKTTVQSGTKP